MLSTRRQFVDMVLAGLAALSLGCTAENDSTTRKNPESEETGLLRLFFSSAITRGYGCGDCILIEYAGPRGAQLFGLIDTGRNLPTQDGASTVTLDYLTSHGVTSLDFLVVTHQHYDHMGDAARILAAIPVGTLYMKQYDAAFSPGVAQGLYEEIVRTALENGVRIVGVDPRALDPASYGTASCPSMSESFRDWLLEHPEATTQSEPFASDNGCFSLGSARFVLVNWESWDEDGALWNMDTGVPHEQVNNENNNSLGVIMRLGNTSAFIAGDMNNADAQTKRNVGDEARLSSTIGLVDLFKLNHHGYSESNTPAFLNALLPKHVVITNDIGFVYGETKSWLDDHGVEYAFTTQDQAGLVVTLDNGKVHMAPESRGQFARKGADLVFVPEEGNADYLSVVHDEQHSTAMTWEELASSIRENVLAWEYDNHNGNVRAESMRIDIDALDTCNATSCITIEKGQRITLFTSHEITIKRAPTLTSEPLFMVKGELAIEGPFTLDGNKGEVERCTASLVVNEGGVLTLVGVNLANNAKVHNAEGTGVNKATCYGGALLALSGQTTIMGGSTFTGNSCGFDEELPVDSQSFMWTSGGGAVATLGGTLTIDDAVIAQNECVSYTPFVSLVTLRGGGLYLTNGASCTCTRLMLRDNHIIDLAYGSHAGGSTDHTTNIRGCGCDVNRALAEIRESRIQKNRAGDGTQRANARGAGISVEYGVLRMDGTTMSENTGVTRGGALSANRARVALKTCTISYNAATLTAGGIMVSDSRSRIRIERCKLEANWAQESDGGALWSEAPVVVRESRFDINPAGGRGGAFYSHGGISIDDRTAFSGNTASSGNDGYIGDQPSAFYAIHATAACAFGPHATSNPLDDGPVLSAFALPRRTFSDGVVINISVTSETGIAEVRVNNRPLQRDRYVATKAGTYLIEAIDLAGRVASQELEVAL